MIARNMLTFAHRSLLAVLFLLVLAPPAGAAEVARTDGATLDASDTTRAGFCAEYRVRCRGIFVSGLNAQPTDGNLTTER